MGAVGGALIAGPLSPSVARVRFIDLGAISGGLVAGGLYVSASNGFRRTSDDGKLQGFFAVTGLGIASGIAAAAYFTRKIEPDLGERSHGAERAEPTMLMEPALLGAPGGALLAATGTF